MFDRTRAKSVDSSLSFQHRPISSRASDQPRMDVERIDQEPHEVVACDNDEDETSSVFPSVTELQEAIEVKATEEDTHGPVVCEDAATDVVVHDKDNDEIKEMQEKKQEEREGCESGGDSSHSSSSSSPNSSSSVSGSEECTWVTWFCCLRGNEFFCEVDEDYISDDFNLTGLSSTVPYYEYALDMILDVEFSSGELTEAQQDLVDAASELLYGLIHARFILTTKGQAIMADKLQQGDFGHCHRVYCQGQAVLPLGQSDTPRCATVNVFCPKCRDIYFPKSQRQAQVDGAFFGTTFAHVLLLTRPQLVVPLAPSQLEFQRWLESSGSESEPKSSAAAHRVYVPRIYGYKIHSTSEYYVGHDDDDKDDDGNGGSKKSSSRLSNHRRHNTLSKKSSNATTKTILA